jgi:hypothetical protein
MYYTQISFLKNTDKDAGYMAVIVVTVVSESSFLKMQCCYVVDSTAVGNSSYCTIPVY